MPVSTLDRSPRTALPAGSEGAARRALREQIDRLEREAARLVARGFPHIPATPRPGAPAGPARLLDLAALERERDSLVSQVADLEAITRRRRQFEHHTRLRLEAMRLEPGRYRSWRIPVRDLGEGGCGVWHVRPRLGLVGRLAGWWELKLSSGCPLARGPRAPRGPVRHE